MVTAARRKALEGVEMGRRLVPGDVLLHPVPLLAIAVLVLNDQVLKTVAAGVLTWKLSDVAGLLFFPLLAVAVVEVASSAIGRWAGPTRRSTLLAVAATGLGFAAIKLIPAAESAYEAVLGVAQWPVRSIVALADGGPIPSVAPVELTRDPTDIVALAAIWLPAVIGLRRAGEAATWKLNRYDLAVGGLSVALLVGATMDGWAHSHALLALESVITPWHAVVYLAFVAVASVLLPPIAFTWLSQGRAAAIAAIPRGYGLSVAGVALFAAMGAADTIWHVVFGIEANAEALLSPTHLGLGFGAALIASGPIRAAWLRHDEAATWPSFVPALLSVVAIAGIVAFALHIANLFVDPWPRFPYELTDVTWYGPYIGVAAAMVPVLILMIPTLLLLVRWRELPAGTLTFLVGGTMAGLTFLHDESVLVGAPVLGGFLADLALLALRPGMSRARLQSFAFVAPAAILAAYFLVLWATGAVAWSAHLIGGAVVIAGATGWALSLLVVYGRLPRRPDQSSTSTT